MLISQYDKNFLVSYFGIDKKKELVSWKYYQPSLKKDVEAYIKSYNVDLDLKVVKHKFYSNQ